MGECRQGAFFVLDVYSSVPSYPGGHRASKAAWFLHAPGAKLPVSPLTPVEGHLRLDHSRARTLPLMWPSVSTRARCPSTGPSPALGPSQESVQRDMGL